jgi:hypothetical protein
VETEAETSYCCNPFVAKSQGRIVDNFKVAYKSLYLNKVKKGQPVGRLEGR